MKMKSEGITVESSGNGDTDHPTPTEVAMAVPVETGVEATETQKRKSSWMKNLGSGMRTLRLRKHGSDKKNETVLNSLGNNSSIVDTTALDSNSQQHPPLPPLPTDSPAETSVPSSPVKTLKGKKNKSADSSTSLKNHTSRLSLRDHMSRSKGKKADAGATTAVAVNGSAPREGGTSGTQKCLNGTTTGGGESSNKADPARFIGDGLSFKAKLIGILEVSGPRGDRICQEALSELKMAVKAAGEHKQKVTVHVALDGLRVRDEKTGDCLYHHQVHKISFIAQDLTDSRAFGYIFGSPDTGHRFFGIKTEKSASQVVMSMRDLFQVVFDLKKKEIERAKQQLEMQQKFLATRAAETANRSSQKSGIAETYIDGACSVGGSPTITTGGAPAEADLLNLEVELTSLQEGLDNIHSTLIDTATSHAPSFNRGSTASIASDPMNPGSVSFTKYNIPHQTDSGRGNAQISVGNNQGDPFGDSFDPFDSTKVPPPPTIVSPSFPTDPFAHVDPFASTKFSGGVGGVESAEFLTADPFAFETPVGSCAFTFPDSGNRLINRQISITSNSSDMSSGKASLNVDIGHPPVISFNLNKADTTSVGFTPSTVTNWTASFEDNFATSTTNEDDKGFGDLFTELDPLGTGRVKPFVDRKDFFHDLKHPPKKALSELSSVSSLASSAVVTATNVNVNSSHSLETSLKPEPASSPLPNSFSTNFNPVNLNELDSSGSGNKVLNKVDVHLRTSSIRAQLPGDTPPSYSPPPPPISSIIETITTPSVYFVSAPPKSLPKKSPQLLRNMTIASDQNSSPKTLPKSTLFQLETFESSNIVGGEDKIPNITPPPRPPHTTLNSLGSVLKANTISSRSTTALPRPHSSDGKRYLTLTSSTSLPPGQPPEPPPRPNIPSNDPVLPPPPLPPKKQSLGPVLSSSLIRVQHNTALKSRSSGDPISNFNDLPLPLPLRKAGQQSSTSSQIVQLPRPRYAFPEESSPSPLPPPPPNTSLFRRDSDVTDSMSVTSASSLGQKQATLPGLTMEAALNQVASLSLSQLAGKLEIPVEKLSTCTIQELAIKLTMMNLKKGEGPERFGSFATLKSTFTPSDQRIESNFTEDDDFSTSSTPAMAFGMDKRTEIENPSVVPPQYDRYAVFRELAESDVGSFSICESEDALPTADDEEGPPSRTLTSRESSSEKTLQADIDAGNALSTSNDITDANFSAEDEDGEEKSVLLDEVVDLNLKAEWATFESNFDEQFVPLTSRTFDRVESPWDSDADRMNKFGPTEIIEEDVQKIKSPKLDHSSQFDFQLFEKPNVSVDPVGRRSSREFRGHDPMTFQRQSSGSSKHSERSLGQRPSSRNLTTSDYSDSGKEKGRSQRNATHWKEENRRPTSRSSGGRRYSREESDEDSGRRRWKKEYYYDDEEDETGSVSPVERRRTGRRLQDNEDCYSTTSSRHGYYDRVSRSRHGHGHNQGKYYSQSLHRLERDGRRRPSETEKYSNHESDFDPYEEERRRGGRGLRGDRDHMSTRPASSGGSGSGGRHHRKPRYRDSSREYYHHHDSRDRRERKHVGSYHGRKTVEVDYEDNGRELSDEEEGRVRRIRDKRRPERERDKRREQKYYYNSASWDSDSPPSGPDPALERESDSLRRGTRLRKSDLERPRDRDRDREPRDRPSSSSYHGDRVDGSSRKPSRFQSDLCLNAIKSKLTVTEFGFEEDQFLAPSQYSQEHHRSNQSEPSKPTNNSQSEVRSNKTHQPTSNSTYKVDSYQQQVPAPQSPFEDNFISQNNLFFPADFSSPPISTPTTNKNEMQEPVKILNTTVSNNSMFTKQNNDPHSNSSESVERSDENEENSSPDIIVREDCKKGMIQCQPQQMIPVVRKPIISDTIHEVPDTEMKKSDSFNIFDRDKDPFADDDFFT